MQPQTVAEVTALIQLNPNDADLFQQLGHLHHAAGRLDEAETAYREVIKLSPSDGLGHLLLANLLCTKKPGEALLYAHRAVALLPTEPAALCCLGDVYLELCFFRQAQESYEQAIELDPDYPLARASLTKWQLFKSGQVKRRQVTTAADQDKAVTTVLLADRFLALHSDDLHVALLKADMLYQLTRYDEAIHLYLDLAERFATARWIIFGKLGQLERYRGNFPAAESWHQRAVDENPSEAGCYVFLGAVQARMGRLIEAEATHRRGTQCASGPIDEAWHNLGLVLRGQGRLDESAAAFRRAIELDEDYDDALDALRDVESTLLLSQPDP